MLCGKNNVSSKQTILMVSGSDIANNKGLFSSDVANASFKWARQLVWFRKRIVTENSSL